MARPDTADKSSLPLQIAAITASRFTANVAYRMIYPFLPVIARALGVDLQAVALTLTARSSLGLAGPLFGSLGDRFGRKVAMLGSLALFSLGLLIVAIWPSYPALFASVLTVGAAKIVFDSSTQAYLGDRVPYERRGRAVAITELGWSTAGLLGIPVVGWLIARSGWSAPFPWLALLGFGMMIILWRVIPGDAPSSGSHVRLLDGLSQVLAHRPAVAALGVAMLIGAANEQVNVVFGAWLEDAFGLQVAALGLASAVIGVAELTGEGSVAGLADRIGVRRTLGIGIALSAGAALALPLISSSLTGALVGLFLFFITFEIAIVSLISMMTELVPGARATLTAGSVAAVLVGRMVGTVAGPILFRTGLLANGITATGLNLLALILLLAFVRTGRAD